MDDLVVCEVIFADDNITMSMSTEVVEMIIGEIKAKIMMMMVMTTVVHKPR